VLVALVLLPIGLAVILFGGWWYAVGVALILGLAAYEFGRLFRTHGQRPALPLLFVFSASFALARFAWGFEGTPELLAAVCLVGMTWHLVDYEGGAANSGSDMALTLGGVLYLGWIGGYFISLRALPDGAWWILLVLPVVWLADTAAYFVGRRFGRRKLAPRLSPKKTWEGYLAGVITGAVSGILLAVAWSQLAQDSRPFSVVNGLIIGTVLAVFTTLGDVGISMIKRQVQVKDSSSLLPGHGGVLDRIDSWLWAGVLGYYLVIWLA
jgi:phosphatidate cytidylyltransferase